MTTQTETFLCARCGRALPASALEQDTYTGFLSCKDDQDCDKAIELKSIKNAKRKAK